ncbi:MAG TPA: hypothetical protein VE685_19660 [Thermoanaerobaculia bacterium]|nr:hypothetical protein [Thermoanaerobaculia bacterium]
MIGFFRLSRTLPTQQQDPSWQAVEKYQKKLRSWGLERDPRGSGYRKRLKRLCRFLLELEQKDKSKRAGESGLEKLQRELGKIEGLEEARGLYIQRLENFQTVMGEIERRDQESEEEYLSRLENWSPLDRLQHQPVGDECRSLKTALRLLLLPAAPASPKSEDSALTLLKAIQEHLNKIRPTPQNSKRIEEAKELWQECFDGCVADWEWAYLQVLVRLARQCLTEKPSGPDCCALFEKAAACLEKAIPKLEKNGLLQARFQGLYGLLAETCLSRARVPNSGPKERLELSYKALVYAQHAVQMEPESVRERLKLIEIFSTLGDYEEMKAEAEIALNLDSGSKTLRGIGASFWDRAASLRGRGARRKVLREAAQFFADALKHVESDPFTGDSPLEQVQAHGWAHYWLGRFQCERGEYDDATAHLRTARSLGFKPFESRVELAWAYLLARDYKRADQAFREAAEEAEHQHSGGASIAWGAGEERGLDDLEFDTYLGWAFLCCERDPDRAREKIEWARTLLSLINRPSQEDLEAALLEASGRANLRDRKVEHGVRDLEAAVRLSPRSGAYCYLAFAKLEQAEAGGEAAPEALREAREAYRLARETDVRGRYRREFWELGRRLQKMEKPYKPTTPSAPPQSQQTAPPT